MDFKPSDQKQKKFKLEQLKRTIEHFLTEKFDDGSLKKRLEDYKMLVNNLEENEFFSEEDLYNHYTKLAEFEVQVDKLVNPKFYKTNVSPKDNSKFNLLKSLFFYNKQYTI